MILIFIDGSQGHVKQSGLEAINYGISLAKKTSDTTVVFLVGNANPSELTNTGVDKVLHFNKSITSVNDAQYLAQITNDAVVSTSATTVIFSHDDIGKAIAPRVSVKLNAGYVSGAIDYPEVEGATLIIKRNVFSGKAFAHVKINSENKVISVLPNSVGKGNHQTVNASVENFENNANPIFLSSSKVEALKDEIPLPQAELVVSGGRGLKGPENWGSVLEIAKVLGAATACSRPVSDSHWRPHHEHVGQTGLAIRPNLYIAIGISGAIQHLAGVNGSKTIVVINKDAEAPFFKAADYGVVGDAFEIMPRLLEAFKKFKANKN